MTLGESAQHEIECVRRQLKTRDDEIAKSKDTAERERLQRGRDYGAKELSDLEAAYAAMTPAERDAPDRTPESVARARAAVEGSNRRNEAKSAAHVARLLASRDALFRGETGLQATVDGILASLRADRCGR